MEQAEKNKEMSTDDLEPFDRSVNKGRVSSTRPSSSASFSSTDTGVRLGGDKAKEDSNIMGAEGNYGNLISLGSEESIELTDLKV